MTVVILTAVPPGLRGHLTRWLLEISPGVFVGHVAARVRDLIWDRVVEFVDGGRALMVYTARGEQRLAFRVHGHDWTPLEFDGVTLMRRQTAPDYVLAARRAPQLPSGGGLSDDAVWRRREARRKFKPKRSSE